MSRLRLLLLCVLLAAVSVAPAFGQGTVMPSPVFSGFDANGDPLAGGKLCTYLSGLATPVATYTNVALTVPNANPVILNSAGRATVYLTPGVSYGFVLRTAGTDATCATGTIVWSQDNISSVPGSSSTLDVLGTAGEAILAGEAVYLSDGSGALTAGQWFKADADLPYRSTLPVVGIAPAAIPISTVGAIRLGGSVSGLVGLTIGATHYVSATAGAVTVTAPNNVRRVGVADTASSLILDVRDPTAPTITAFRGLSLGTAEDLAGGTAYTTVTMFHADEIVTSDGARRTPADNLSAVITTAGIGGLRASQAEAASTLYKVMYAYGATGEGLYFEQAKDYFLDTSFTTARDATQQLRELTATATDKLAQGVTFTTAGKLESVDVELTRAGAVGNSIWLTLEADIAGDASGIPLATSNKIAAGTVNTAAQILKFVFRTPYTTTAALYHLVLNGDYARSDAVNIAWGGVAAGGYATGVARQYNGAVWANATGVGDFYFRAYVTRNDNAVVAPVGYDTGYAQVGWVYNDAGSNFAPFLAKDRVVQFSNAPPALGAVTSTVPLLVSLSTGIPPGPINTTLSVVNSVAGPSQFSVVPVAGSNYLMTVGQGYYRGGVDAYLVLNSTGFMPPLRTEFQSCYMGTTAGTITPAISAFEW